MLYSAFTALSNKSQVLYIYASFFKHNHVYMLVNFIEVAYIDMSMKWKFIEFTNNDSLPSPTSQYYFQQLVLEPVLWQKLDHLKEIHRNNGKEAKEESASDKEDISKEKW